MKYPITPLFLTKMEYYQFNASTWRYELTKEDLKNKDVVKSFKDFYKSDKVTKDGKIIIFYD